jgi:hypothetical protein
MIDYNDWSEVQNLLKSDQEADHDRREKSREVESFLHVPDGQWDDDRIRQKMDAMYRGTFDMCNPIVDQIATEVENQDYSVSAAPTDAEGSEKQADFMAGMIRAIQSWSKADDLVYKPATRVCIESGYAVAEVTQEWADADVMEQDLFLRIIPNAVDRVWIDQGSVNPDWSDANHGHVMQALTADAAKRKFPNIDRELVSVGSDRGTVTTTGTKPDVITIGRIVYRKPVDRELVLMSDNRVLLADEEFESIKAELADVGIEEVRRRTRKTFEVKSRLYDGADWLTEEEDTVFSILPLAPMYGNHRVADNKVWWRGAIEKLMDSQRVYNYSESRNVSDTALAPKEKIVATLKQMAGHSGWSTLNTNSDPALPYTVDEKAPPPFKIGGPQPNAGILSLSENMRRNITQSASMFASNMGDNPGLQSGIAIERLQDAGNSGADKYINARRIMGGRVYEILADAIPKTYDSTRSAFILGEDGKGSVEKINDTVIDNETGKPVVVNDLSKGRYQVTCKAGKSFTSRQAEGSAALLELGQVKPDALENSMDIVYAGMSFPGSEDMAERERERLLQVGASPASQMSDEEKAQAQAAAEAAQNQPDPAMELLRIEQEKNQQQAANDQSKNAVAEINAETKRMEVIQKSRVDSANLDLKTQEQASAQQMDVLEAFNLMADTLGKLKDAMGVDAIVGPNNQQAYIQQAGEITEAQEDAGFPDIDQLADRDIGE